MNEQRILDTIRARQPARLPSSLILGIGDDAAIYRPQPGEDLVFTTDMMHEGRHFLSHYPPYAIGWKALARSLSDLAAMGAKPRFALFSIGLGPGADLDWVDGVAAGFAALAARQRITLAGGDISRAAHGCLEVMACGSVPQGSALLRNGARPGDRIYVSGRLGAGQLGLQSPSHRAAYRHHLMPEPRLPLGTLLRERRIPSSMMDLSDGLSTDLERLLRASGVAARLHGRLPCFPGASQAHALHGGDDYELLFSVRPGRTVPPKLAGIPLTCVGEVIAGAPGTILLRNRTLQPEGWDHFRDQAGGAS